MNFAAPLFAIGVVLVASTDWALVSPGRPDLPVICAKSEATCREAIPVERWNGANDRRNPVVNPIDGSYSDCVPVPGCFPGRSNCIVRFNCQ